MRVVDREVGRDQPGNGGVSQNGGWSKFGRTLDCRFDGFGR